MVDTDTFLTTLYVMADDFTKSILPLKSKPGPAPSLYPSEVITLALFGQWFNFGSERGFYRWAQRHLRSAFPKLPHRSQFNRLLRHHKDDITAFSLHLSELMAARCCRYEALDSSGIPTRDSKRRGCGWLAGQADIGWSNRIGWYEGFHLLTSVNPSGVITGFGFGPGSTADQTLAETFFALRKHPQTGVSSVGKVAVGYYIVDKGFEGEFNHKQWKESYGAEVICPPKRNARRVWPKKLRRLIAGIRQIVETVYNKLINTFRLDRERPHDLVGFQARLAAKVGLHNFCMWLNKELGRPLLAFADLIDW